MITNSTKKPYKTLVAPKSQILSRTDTALVNLSSLLILGGAIWGPAFFYWLYKKWRTTPNDDEKNKKKRRLYRNIFITAVLVTIWGPHRHRKVGEFLKIREWRFLKAWTNYVAMEVISEASDGKKHNFDMKKDQAIFAIIPHGIIPIPLGFAAIPKLAIDVFGEIRPVVASATRFVPGFRTMLEWVGCIDANRSSVEKALSKGHRIGVSPGGIAEMFEGYPKPDRHPNDECAILKNRKGFVRMALKNEIPLVPVYCFGGAKLFRRLQLPMVVEKLSNFLRISIVVVFGKFGKRLLIFLLLG
jgi:hypothetical protein